MDAATLSYIPRGSHDAPGRRDSGRLVMLTRIEVDGFKNLVNFSLDLGPYTCIAGANGVGKSYIFDAIRFLSLLTDHTINQSALLIRSSEPDTGEIGDLFFSANGSSVDRIRLAAEMIVDKSVVDDFGRPGEPSSTFLRYEVVFRREPPSLSAGPFGGLILEKEDLRYIQSGKAAQKLRFLHNRQPFTTEVVYNRRRGAGYISTTKGTISVHQDGGSSGRRFLRTGEISGASRTSSKDDYWHGEHGGDTDDPRSAPGNAAVAHPGAGTIRHAKV